MARILTERVDYDKYVREQDFLRNPWKIAPSDVPNLSRELLEFCASPRFTGAIHHWSGHEWANYVNGIEFGRMIYAHVAVVTASLRRLFEIEAEGKPFLYRARGTYATPQALNDSGRRV
jgi:hypothetical protein